MTAKLQQKIEGIRAERGFTTDPLRVFTLLNEEVGEASRFEIDLEEAVHAKFVVKDAKRDWKSARSYRRVYFLLRLGLWVSADPAAVLAALLDCGSRSTFDATDAARLLVASRFFAVLGDFFATSPLHFPHELSNRGLPAQKEERQG